MILEILIIFGTLTALAAVSRRVRRVSATPLFVTVLLLCTAIPTFAQNAELPRIAVYVTSDMTDNVPQETRNALGTFILDALVNSGRYRTIERSTAFLAEIEREHETQRSGMIDDDQISALGRQAGVQFLCIANITGVLGSFQISARIIDVETADVIASGVSTSPLATIDDLRNVSAEVVYRMIGIRVRTDQNFELLTDQEQTALERSIEQTIQQTMTESSWRNRRSFWIGLGLDVIGLGIIGYGVYENSNRSDYLARHIKSSADEAETRRNIAYGVGAALLLTGISIQLFF